MQREVLTRIRFHSFFIFLDVCFVKIATLVVKKVDSWGSLRRRTAQHKRVHGLKVFVFAIIFLLTSSDTCTYNFQRCICNSLALLLLFVLIFHNSLAVFAFGCKRYFFVFYKIFVDRFGQKSDFVIFLQSFIRRSGLAHNFYDFVKNLEVMFGLFSGYARI